MRQGSGRTIGRQAAVVVGSVLWLTGCGGGDVFENPQDWWHQLQGGPIADQRPPPPGVADPYPNLGRVPAKPTPTDPATRAGLTAQLAGQRDRVRRMAAQDPLVWPAPGTQAVPGAAPVAAAVTATGRPAAAAAVAAPVVASPGAPAPGAPAPAVAPASPAVSDDTSRMVLDAASAPAVPAAAAAAAAKPPAADPRPPMAFVTPPSPDTVAAANVPIPALPGDAPRLPNLPGLPSSNPQPVVVRALPSTRFSFAPGSAAVPETAVTALRALVARRTGAPVAVQAGGDARSSAPAAQAAALPLALRRSEAIVAALVVAGVPSSAIRAEAVAPGREGSIRLVE